MRRILIIFISLLITIGAAFFFSSKSDDWLDSFRESKAHVLVANKSIEKGKSINKDDLIFREVGDEEKIPYGAMVFIPEKTTSEKDFLKKEKEKAFKWVSGKITKKKLDKNSYLTAEDLITFDESNRLNNALVLTTVESVNIGDRVTPFNVILSSVPKDTVKAGYITFSYNQSIDDFLMKNGDLQFTKNLSENSEIGFFDIVDFRTVDYLTKGKEPVLDSTESLDRNVYFVESTKNLFEKRKSRTSGFLPLKISDLSSVVSLPGTKMDLYLGSLTSNSDLTKYRKIASGVRLYSYNNIDNNPDLSSDSVYWTLVEDSLAKRIKQSRLQGIKLIAIPANGNFIDYQEGFSFCKGNVCMKKDSEEDDIFDEEVEKNGLKPLSDVDISNIDSSKKSVSKKK